MAPPKAPKQPVKNRPPSPFNPGPLVHGDWGKLHDALNKHAAAWEQWGHDVLEEIDALEKGNREQDGTPGNPPTDATQPPKPPFRP